MLSFIIIGRNEGWKLSKCLESVLDFVYFNNIDSYEIIYVDSKSTDDSIERAKAFSEVRVFQIIGKCNAAVARNIGANESKGDVLFFIDGDMEIQADFYNVAFKNENELVYPFLSGGLINFNYDSNWNFINKEIYGRNTKEDKYENTTGGIFIIEGKLWEFVGGMRTKYMRNQDLDLGLRLSRKKYPILRKKEIIAYHHTIPYSDKNRTWKLLFNGSELYPMVLFREHIFFLPALKRFIFENYTMLTLVLSVLCLIVFNTYFPFIFFLMFLIIKSYRATKQISLNLFNNIFKIFLRDVIRFFSIFFYYPKNIEFDYKQL